MDYPLQSSSQLSAHLRSLRKARGLSQLQLGALLGVGQTRIARIERAPAAVSVEQFLDLLGALGAQLVLRSTAPAAASDSNAIGPRARPACAAPKPSGNDDPW